MPAKTRVFIDTLVKALETCVEDPATCGQGPRGTPAAR
jgi:hypothetical protein